MVLHSSDSPIMSKQLFLLSYKIVSFKVKQVLPWIMREIQHKFCN